MDGWVEEREETGYNLTSDFDIELKKFMRKISRSDINSKELITSRLKNRLQIFFQRDCIFNFARPKPPSLPLPPKPPRLHLSQRCLSTITFFWKYLYIMSRLGSWLLAPRYFCVSSLHCPMTPIGVELHACLSWVAVLRHILRSFLFLM